MTDVSASMSAAGGLPPASAMLPEAAAIGEVTLEAICKKE